MTIDKLYKIIEKRKADGPDSSYVASLFREGEDRIIQKVGEEAIETIIAAKGKNKERIISEAADLLFHLLIMLSALQIKPSEIFEELGKRRKKCYPKKGEYD